MAFTVAPKRATEPPEPLRDGVAPVLLYRPAHRMIIEPQDAPNLSVVPDGPTALVVEQDPAQGAGVASILADAGFEVHRAGLEDALPALVRVQPGLVVACVETVDAAVLAFTGHLVERYGFVAPPVIVVTVLADDASMRALFATNVRDVLSAPVVPALLRVKAKQFHRHVGLPRDPIGGYVVRRRLGLGGMGAVYLAERDGVEVALKVLDVKIAGSDPELIVRFRREADILAFLEGRGAPAFHGSGRAGDYFYCAMELVRGVTLRDALDAGPLPPDAVARLIVDVGSALEGIHASGLVHRDVKPTNVMIAHGDRRAKLIDFGLSRAVADLSLTSSSCVLGTPAYVAPELLRGEPVTGAADAFSLGMTALEAATGRCPVAGTPAAIIDQLVNGQVPDPAAFLSSADPALVGTLAGLLQPDPAARTTLAEAVRALSGG